MTNRRHDEPDAMEILCVEESPPDCGVVVFGASGDLTRRKLLPALFNLHQRRLMPESYYVLGYARTDYSDQQFRDLVGQALRESQPQAEPDQIQNFLQRCHYQTGDYKDLAAYEGLSQRVSSLDRTHATHGRTLFYLSTPPSLYQAVVSRLFQVGLTSQEEKTGGWRRVVIEKPIGHDLLSARKLEAGLGKVLSEDQIYRIDHYLGKETVQNIMVLRFANAIFEPIWNRQFIDHVQITAAESIGVGSRAGYYDGSGLLRDMFQNHMLQLLTLVAMEPPCSFAADCVRDEKIKVLRSMRPFPGGEELGQWIVRGQYAPGTVDGQRVAGYRQEEEVSEQSVTETFAAAKVLVDNWRWQGVPFYLRSGKRLPRRLTEIAIVFRQVPHSVFTPLLAEDFLPNTLVLNVQPEEGAHLSLQAKRPGPKLCMGTLNMHFNYKEAFGGRVPEAYERLLLDCMLGDQTLFIRTDTVEKSWQLLTPVLEQWRKSPVDEGNCRLHAYPAGSWGPQAAADLLARDGRRWRI